MSWVRISEKRSSVPAGVGTRKTTPAPDPAAGAPRSPARTASRSTRTAEKRSGVTRIFGPVGVNDVSGR